MLFRSGEPVENVRMRVNVAGREHVSPYFDLSPDGFETVPVVIGGYTDLKDIEDIFMAVEITPHEDEIVRMARSREIEVGDGRLILQVFNEAFSIRIRSTKLAFRIFVNCVHRTDCLGGFINFVEEFHDRYFMGQGYVHALAALIQKILKFALQILRQNIYGLINGGELRF